MHFSFSTILTTQLRKPGRRSVLGICAAISCAIALALISPLAAPTLAVAQTPGPPGAPGGAPSLPVFGGSPIPDDKPPVSRTVAGRVLNNDDVALVGAVVYLRDVNTNRVLTLFVDDTASFRYGQLDRHVDYRIWAEYKGKKSPEKLLSSLDLKDTIQVRLRIDTQK